MKKILFLVTLCFALILSAGCTNKNISDTCSITGAICVDTTDLTGSIDAIMLALKQQDFPTLSQFVGTQGLRFSPYEYVDVATDIVLTTTQVFNALTISAAYTWGSYDGTGDPINLSIGQYRSKFVYDVDFITAPQVYHNQKFERGNIINTIFDVYSGKHIVEYHFPGFDPQYGGMDWRSLYLVLENVGGQRYLIGIVHGSWTI